MKRITAMLAIFALLPAGVRANQFGTGFAISPKGYLVTCHHVVRGAGRILVHHGGKTLEAEIVAADPRSDLAILKVEHWPGRYLGLTPSSEVTFASDILAAGFPDPAILGRNPKISTGIVNALSGAHDDPRFIQISAPVQPGNSGGPLLSSSGRVVGVVASGLNSIDRMAHGGYLPQSVNYAIKAELVLALLKNASISHPKLGTRTSAGPKQVERAIQSIGLVEAMHARPATPSRPASGLAPAQFSSGNTPPSPSRSSSTPSRQAAQPGPWIFPDSHLRPLSAGEVDRLPAAALWRARNEIYLRHGFIFPTEDGQRFAREFGDAYRPVTGSVDAVKRQLSGVEIANLRLIAARE